MKTSAEILRNPVHLLAFGLGSGLSPKAPGTAGTSVAVGLYLLLPVMHWSLYLSFLLLTFAIGVWLCGKTSRDLEVKDPGGIVWDEFVGYWITMFMAPAGWTWIIAGFVLFRILDIFKPWPIKWADSSIKGGLGIMLDDVIAGIMAALCLQAAALLLVSS